MQHNNHLEKAGNLQIKSKNITIGKMLGEGGTSIVYKGKLKKKTVAIKILNVDSDWSKPIFENEMGIMSAIALLPKSNKHVLKLNGCIDDERSKALVVEYLPDGDLVSYLKNHKNPDVFTLHQFSFDVASGLKYLHENGFLHCDLKPDNIMLKSKRAKLIDFGFSKTKDNNKSPNLAGTAAYVAPELVLADIPEYTEETDMYAYGILLFVIYTGKNPYSDAIQTPLLLEMVSENNLRPEITDTIPKNAVELMTSAWMQNPIFRPSAKLAADNLKKIMHERIPENKPKKG